MLLKLKATLKTAVEPDVDRSVWNFTQEEFDGFLKTQDSSHIGPHSELVPHTIEGETFLVENGYKLLLEGKKLAMMDWNAAQDMNGNDISERMLPKMIEELKKAGLKFFPIQLENDPNPSFNQHFFVTQPGEEWRAKRLKYILEVDSLEARKNFDVKKEIELQKEIGKLLGYSETDVKEFIRLRCPDSWVKRIEDTKKKISIGSKRRLNGH